MDTKRLSHLEIKDADKGEVSAVFSTFNVIDKDGDVTLPGAFTDGAEVVISSYGHTSWSGALPVGTGRIRTTDSEAILDGKFFMDTAAGKDTFKVVKRLGVRQEWSYGFDILDADSGVHDGTDVRMLKSLAVHEVSPVLVGAGVNTRTLSAKSATEQAKDQPVLYKTAIRPHASSVTNRAWDGPAVVSGIADDATVSELRSVFAWAQSGADPEAKASYKFPHHHGVDGPANIRACLAGIAALNGARGGADIPDDDRQGVYNHLSAHLEDADREPPELRSDNSGTLKLHDDLISVMAEVERITDRASEVMALRAVKGKSISSVNVEVLAWMYEDWGRLGRLLKSLLDTPTEAVATEKVRMIAHELKRRNQS